MRAVDVFFNFDIKFVHFFNDIDRFVSRFAAEKGVVRESG